MDKRWGHWFGARQAARAARHARRKQRSLQILVHVRAHACPSDDGTRALKVHPATPRDDASVGSERPLIKLPSVPEDREGVRYASVTTEAVVPRVRDACQARSCAQAERQDGAQRMSVASASHARRRARAPRPHLNELVDADLAVAVLVDLADEFLRARWTRSGAVACAWLSCAPQPPPWQFSGRNWQRQRRPHRR